MGAIKHVTDADFKLDIVKLNIDDNRVTTANYRITSIPALKVFSGGQVVKEIIGGKPKAALLRDLADFVD